MSLDVTVKNPTAPPEASDRHFRKPAGPESYRDTVWGTPAMAKRSPLLAKVATDLHLAPHQFNQFEAECRAVATDADDIATELGWRSGGGDSLREYVRFFLEAVAFARQHQSDWIHIW